MEKVWYWDCDVVYDEEIKYMTYHVSHKTVVARGQYHHGRYRCTVACPSGCTIDLIGWVMHINIMVKLGI